MNKLPVQNVITDNKGTKRFEENPLVSTLIDNFTYEGMTGLNALSLYYQINSVDEKYYEQITQLIGYSVSGFSGLSTTTDETWSKVMDSMDEVSNACEEIPLATGNHLGILATICTRKGDK